ncbi:hypothetical protein DSO57_1021178 [Entomophthora muscae]|uniref:Uncharacterized protein n=1 Tax=Entomophthora muscae TaxID=34485 RepID=A0ACC2SG72_9FUNG|nr:hypothetical protein DSO57_1021178 [Entomophthora muscae]
MVGSLFITSTAGGVRATRMLGGTLDIHHWAFVGREKVVVIIAALVHMRQDYQHLRPGQLRVPQHGGLVTEREAELAHGHKATLTTTSGKRSPNRQAVHQGVLHIGVSQQ